MSENNEVSDRKQSVLARHHVLFIGMQAVRLATASLPTSPEHVPGKSAVVWAAA
jgi:hypothetical protein